MKILRIASWPGPSFAMNEVIPQLCEGLSAAGGSVIDITDPGKIGNQDLDVLQIHWPEQVFWKSSNPILKIRNTLSTILTLRRLKRRNVKIVWMVHNLAPHDLKGLDALLWRLYSRELYRAVDGIVTLSPGTVRVVQRTIPEIAALPATFVWHPAYPPIPDSGAIRSRMREQLGFPQDSTVLAYVGLVRPYKGVDELVRVVRAMPDENIRLVIAGKPIDQDTAALIEGMAEGDPRIKLVFRRLETQELVEYTAVADAIVAPLVSYLHSGSIIYSLSADRPVITPAAPFSSALAAEGAEDWVRLYTPPLNADILRRNAAPPTAPLRSREGWSHLEAGRRLMDFYRSLITRGRA